MGIEKKEKKTTIVSKTIDFMLKKIRMMFLEHTIYFGTHADNIKKAQEFIITGNYIAMGWNSDSLKIPVLMPKGGNISNEKDFEAMDALVEEQIRVIRRKFRKEQKSVLFYVHDNLITRALGFKETKFHMQCTGIIDHLRPVERMAYEAKLNQAQSLRHQGKKK
jgi:hypothetical protein